MLAYRPVVGSAAGAGSWCSSPCWSTWGPTAAGAQWINDGLFFDSSDDKDPLVGPNDGSGQFTIPQRPIRRRLTDLPGFVVNRGGEYCFIPSLSALRWLSELDT